MFPKNLSITLSKVVGLNLSYLTTSDKFLTALQHSPVLGPEAIQKEAEKETKNIILRFPNFEYKQI